MPTNVITARGHQIPDPQVSRAIDAHTAIRASREPGDAAPKQRR